MRELQHIEFDRLTARLRKHLAEAAELGQIRGGADIDFVTHQIAVLIDGVSAERVLSEPGAARTPGGPARRPA